MKKLTNEELLNSLMEGYQIISYNWVYLYVNEEAARQARSNREELTGMIMYEKFPGIEQSPMFKTLKKCMFERVPDQIENRFEYPDGTDGWFELRIEPVEHGLSILSIDITDRKKAELELQNLTDTLELQIALRTAELELINRELTDSIVYAEQIQQARLPDYTHLKSDLDCFVYYRPKSIVSGDFYFFHRKDETIYIAAADCTGHGVPGAILSMLCMEKLTDSVEKYDDITEILASLNASILNAFSKAKHSRSRMEGMDIALAAINTDNGQLTFAGANRPVWFIKKDQEISEVKGTRTGIGGQTRTDQVFEKTVIQLDKGDLFYLFTDGYCDQFGGMDDKKMKAKKFRELLFSIRDKKMSKQKEVINNYLEGWRTGNELVDDILVVGVRV